MHIVLANQWFPPESGWGGVGMYNYVIANAYRALGHEVTVLASRTSEHIPAQHLVDGIQVQRLLVRDAYRMRRLPVIGRYVRPVQQLDYARRVDGALRDLHARQPIDVVEFAEVNAEGLFYAREPVVPVVVRCHTPTFVLRRFYRGSEMPFDTRIIGACERSLIRSAHALSAPSNDMARLIERECDLQSQTISVIPNALFVKEITQTSLPKAEDQVDILHVGRLERVKGVMVLAEAIPQVLQQCPHAHFTFVGDDRRTMSGTSQRAEIESYLAAASAGAHVEFRGAVDQAELEACYQRADICVVPSMLYESFSYTCAQAMAAGKPVVATRIGGISETVEDGVSGILVSPGRADELASAIIQLLGDGDLREQMGRAGREKVAAEFDPLKIAQSTLHVYERAKAIHGG
jgi:glycosyltransferase involved in cell wall biosynthesis